MRVRDARPLATLQFLSLPPPPTCSVNIPSSPGGRDASQCQESASVTDTRRTPFRFSQTPDSGHATYCVHVVAVKGPSQPGSQVIWTVCRLLCSCVRGANNACEGTPHEST